MNTKSRARRKLSATDRRNLHTLLLVSAFDAVNIGRRIAQARKEAGGMTQEELGDLLGVTTRSVQGYEAGDVVPYKYFSRLEEIFSRSLDWFLHGDRDPETAAAVAVRLEELEAKVALGFQAVEAAIEQLAARLPRRDQKRG